MRDSIRKALYVGVITLVSFAPGAYAGGVVVPMPEPSNPVVLAIDLLLVGGLIFLFRSRASGAKSVVSREKP